jgi:hypothetical protein
LVFEPQKAQKKNKRHNKSSWLVVVELEKRNNLYLTGFKNPSGVNSQLKNRIKVSPK